MNDPIHFVLGFVFTRDQSKVWVMRKSRPRWQAGKLNGVGGHIEANESCVGAMQRECLEETGIDIPASYWTFFGLLDSPEAKVFCFRAYSDEEPKSKTDEPVYVVPVRWLPSTVIPNLHWLVPMALNMPEGQCVTMTETIL